MQKIILYILPLILLLASCKKWLDVKPESQVAAEQLFTTAEGFEEALDGVYVRCAEGDVYGTELTMGLPDVLAQDWVITPNADYLNYLQASEYNYTDPNFITKKDGIWSGLYNAISNDNLLLQYLDSGKVLSNTEHSLIKGEALALRAYIHFDLLRLFAPSYLTGSAKAGIPYVTAFSNKVTPTSTVSDAIGLAINDLTNAKALLKQSDPILSPAYVVGYPSDTAAKELSASTLFLQNRRHRLNYYAVCGELARIYLYINDKTNALSNAMEVINSRKFPWTSQSDFINPDPKLIDRICYKELLFGFPIPTMTGSLINYFGSNGNGLYLTANLASSVYETNGVGGSDLRYKEWFTPGTVYSFVKYSRDADTNLHPLMAPALKLSEIYYIAAECTYTSNPVLGLSYVDTVRSVRGVDPLTISSADDFMTELVKEERKDLYGEGQLFYMYKRLNRGIVGPSGIVNTPTDKVFVLPLPINEIEFGGQ